MSEEGQSRPGRSSPRIRPCPQYPHSDRKFKNLAPSRWANRRRRPPTKSHVIRLMYGLSRQRDMPTSCEIKGGPCARGGRPITYSIFT
jgi:hypothetical protein